MTNFLAANWLWIAFFVVVLTMHRHGGCGMHGHHQSPERDAENAHDHGGGRSTS